MKIADLDLGASPLLLAPMEDVTDHSFRLLCREFGAALVYTEFVNADAIVRNVSPTLQKMAVEDSERPIAIQIYGREPDVMADAAQIAATASPDIIDINFGCPVKRVAGKGAGAGLLQDIPKMLAIISSVVNAVSLPVTVKTRVGWDFNNIVIPTLAEQIQDVGAKALTIHGRTRSQMYTGEANWEIIAQTKANPRLSIPIIGNGDITTGEIAKKRFEESAVDAIMVGRATIGQPWIFEEMRATIDGKTPIKHSPRWYLDLLKRQVRESVSKVGEKKGIWHIRRHLAATPLFKGIPNFREMRIKILQTNTVDELFLLLDATLPMIEANLL